MSDSKENKEKNFEPLIKGNPRGTLKQRDVNIKDTMNFERRSVIHPAVTEQENTVTQNQQKEKNEKENEVERRKKTMKTQKMSLDVLLKLDILDPFLRSTEHIEHDGKLSINEKIELLMDSYINSRLSARQLEGYQAIYQNYLDT